MHVLVVVTGMHRSGTSALAELLSEIGCDLGPANQLMGATASNLRGHFESLPVVEFNERILGMCGAHWLHPLIDPEKLVQLAGTTAGEARQVLERAGFHSDGDRPFVVKDPRFCITLPYWQEVLGYQPFVVGCYRSPNEVVASLLSRDELHVDYGRRLWAHYNSQLLRSAPLGRSIIVAYHEMLRAPQEIARDLAKTLGLPDPGDAGAATIDGEMQHQRGPLELPAELSPLWKELEGWRQGERVDTGSLTMPSALDAGVASALTNLAAENWALRAERDLERSERRHRDDQVQRSDVERRKREAELGSELAEVRAQLGDYEHSRAAGMARLSWSAKSWLRERRSRRSVRARAKLLRPPRDPAEAFSFVGTVDTGVSVIVAASGNLATTSNCLREIAAMSQSRASEFVIVVPSGIDPAVQNWTRDCEGVVQAESTGTSISELLEAGAGAASGSTLVFVPAETTIADGWLSALVRTLQSDASIGAVGAKLIDMNGCVQEAGSIVWSDAELSAFGVGFAENDDRIRTPRHVDACVRSGLAISRRAFDAANLFEQRLQSSGAFGVDLGLSLRNAGYRFVYEPTATSVARSSIPERELAMSATEKEFLRAKWSVDLRNQPLPTISDSAASWRNQGPHVLVVDHEIPAPDQDAGSLRIFTLIEVLASQGCRVSFVPQNRFERPPYAANLRRLGVEVLVNPVGQDLLETVAEGVDLVIASRPLVANAIEPIVRDRFPQATFVYDMVDFHGLRQRRQRELFPGTLEAEPGIERIERRLARSADVVIAVTKVEADLLRELEREANVMVLPTIHRPCRSSASFDDRHGVMFVGSWRHPPNQDAIEWLTLEIAPRLEKLAPDIVIHIVGSDVPTDQSWAQRSNVEVHGWVEDLGSVADRVRLNVAPVRFGAGIKGKVGDALARGLPTVTTPIGAEGFEALSEALVVVDGADDIASALAALHSDRQQWDQLADAGASLIEQHQGLPAATRIVEALLDEVQGRSA